MKKIKVILAALVLIGSLTACVPDEFEEVQKDEILEAPSTDPDDEDEEIPPSSGSQAGS